MQDYYEQNVYGQESATVIKLSLVGTLGNFALNVFSPFVQILVSTIGIKSSVLLATVLSVAGLELSSFTLEVKYLRDSYKYQLKIPFIMCNDMADLAVAIDSRHIIRWWRLHYFLCAFYMCIDLVSALCIHDICTYRRLG